LVLEVDGFVRVWFWLNLVGWVLDEFELVFNELWVGPVDGDVDPVVAVRLIEVAFPATRTIDNKPTKRITSTTTPPHYHYKKNNNQKISS
jgi:hypothetical protein